MYSFPVNGLRQPVVPVVRDAAVAGAELEPEIARERSGRHRAEQIQPAPRRLRLLGRGMAPLPKGGISTRGKRATIKACSREAGGGFAFTRHLRL